MSLRTVLLLALLVAVATAFAPNRPAFRKTTKLHPKFLQDLGFEKPSWLPDFGGGKKEEEKKDEPVAAATGEGGDEPSDEEPKEE